MKTANKEKKDGYKPGAFAKEKKVDAPKEAKAVKPAKEKKEKAEGATHKYEAKTKVKILNKENPHREGSARAFAFDVFVKCKTVGDYYLAKDNATEDDAAKLKTKYIKDWVESGHAELVE